MRVLVLGAYGLIGTAIVSRLRERGHAVIGAGRSLGSARQRFPNIDWIEADLGKDHAPDDWHGLLVGIEAVVHAAGVLQEGAGDDVHAHSGCRN